MGRIGNIVNRKNKQDSLKAKIFTKHARAISVAAKQGGADPEYNAALKTAIDKAKADNMPNDNIDRAVKKGSGADAENFEHMTYEGYGPGGVAVMVSVLSDNKNRTAGNIRYYFDKNGGNMGTTGCVAFMFEEKGEIVIGKDGVDADKIMEEVLELDIEDFQEEEDCFVILTSPENHSEVAKGLKDMGYTLASSEINMIPANYSQIDEAHQKSFEKMLDMMEEDEDVQEVYHNAQID